MNLNTILYGPPGTGKTTFARALAGRLGWPFVELLPSKLASGEGTLANELREAFIELGRLDHVVIFIDEFDEIAPARESRPASAGVVNELLKSIPELRRRPGKLLVCATNFVETIDPAVMRQMQVLALRRQAAVGAQHLEPVVHSDPPSGAAATRRPRPPGIPLS